MDTPYTETRVPAPDTSDEIIKTRLYKADETSEVIVLITGYYMGPSTIDGLANLLHAEGYTVAVISNYGAPTWIDTSIDFAPEVPKLVRSWTSAAQLSLQSLHTKFPNRTFHLVGYSLGGPASLLCAAHSEYHYTTLTLLASIGIQGPIEATALRAMRHPLTRPFGFILSRLTLLSQVLRIALEYHYFLRAPKHREKYKPIAIDKADRATEGAKKIGYQVGQVKLTFYIGRFIALVKHKNTRLCLIGHKSDAYVSVGALEAAAKEFDASITITPGTHDHVKTNPEDIAPVILKHLQAKS